MQWKLTVALLKKVPRIPSSTGIEKEILDVHIINFSKQ